MKLDKNEKQRIASGDVKFLKEILKKELEDIKDGLLVYKEAKGIDDVLRGKGAIIQELIKVLES